MGKPRKRDICSRPNGFSALERGGRLGGSEKFRRSHREGREHGRALLFRVPVRSDRSCRSSALRGRAAVPGTAAVSDLAISVLADPARALTFDVIVRDARGDSRHRVTLRPTKRRAGQSSAPTRRLRRGGDAVPPRPRAEGVDPPRVRHRASFGAIFLNSTKRFPAISPARRRGRDRAPGPEPRGGRFR